MKIRGIIFALIAAITFGLSPALVSRSYELGNNFLMMGFLRHALVLPLLYFMIGQQGLSLKVSKNDLKSLSIMTVFGTSLSILVLYLSYNYIPAGLATSVHFIYPTIVAIASALVFKEEFSLARKLAVVLSLMGIIFFIDLGGGSNNLLIGVLLAFTSGSAYSFYIVYMAKSGVMHLSTLVITFYNCLIASITLGLIALFTNHLAFTSMGVNGWLLTIFISLIMTITGTLFTQLAIKYVGTTVTSVMSTLEPITTLAVGFLFFNDPLTSRHIIASVFILLAVLVLALDQNKMAKKRAEHIEIYEEIIS